MKVFRFLIETISDIAGQLCAGVGFMISLGAFVAEIYIMVPLGLALMILGFFLLRG